MTLETSSGRSIIMPRNMAHPPFIALLQESNLWPPPAPSRGCEANRSGQERTVAVVETEKQGDIAVIRMNNPPVNALGHALRSGLETAFAEANADPAVKAIVLTGTGRFFSAGADITEFATGMKEPFLPQLIDTIEASANPVVAAVNGTALGGGLKLALGCHYRVAAKDVRQLGLPEIKLGIIPGAGGTQRLPRAIGVEKALELILSGAFIDAKAGAAA